jgi:LmbE family N-acetylglucosaminyl deacetylase
MTKILFGLFAHPDDEAFGPAGTLIQEVKNGTELHLITFTTGENGTNPDAVIDLGAERYEEWKKAGNLIGATAMHHLGYTDGTLSNLTHIEAAASIEHIIRKTVDGRTPNSYEIEFISLDTNGMTGHIDHIVASRTACLVYERLRSTSFPVTRVRLACIPRRYAPAVSTDFVFMEPGRTEAEIDETVDARQYQAEIREVIACHVSQRNDGNNALKQRGDLLGIDTFVLYQ